ncbi:MAG: phosphate ABC transporter permease PstC, partial [Proteobacteria bacterium]|nr:phosphate ABC transporter permease PstC [Pseudomonadota bacterium]
MPIPSAAASGQGARAARAEPPSRKPLFTSTMADRLFALLARAAALLTLGLLLAIMAALCVGAWPAIREYGLGFFFSSEWDPVQNRYG